MATCSGDNSLRGSLSAEQLLRMEENRRRAQERLAGKRAHTHVARSGISNLPSRSRPLGTQLITSSAGTDQFGPPPSKVPAYSSTSLLSSFQTSLQKGNPTQTCNSSSNIRELSTTTTSSHYPNSAHYQKNSESSNAAKSSQPVSVAAAVSQLKFTELQHKIKANVTMVSKTRFKVMVGYDSTLIEIFKKMPTRSYGKTF